MQERGVNIFNVTLLNSTPFYDSIDLAFIKPLYESIDPKVATSIL